jgi:predicted RNase H-like HicB family nuclease
VNTLTSFLQFETSVESREKKMAEDEVPLRTDFADSKIRVKRHADGYVAYPLGLEGVVVGQGDTYDEALADVKSAIRFHVETFGIEILDDSLEANEAPD